MDPCPECNGEGIYYDTGEPCVVCDGSGEVYVE